MHKKGKGPRSLAFLWGGDGVSCSFERGSRKESLALDIQIIGSESLNYLF